MLDKLKDYGLNLRESDNPDRDPVDFTIESEEDNVAWVWGHSLFDLDWECDHPYQCIEFGDGEEQCECLLCGSFGDYHYEEDSQGNKVPEPHEWYPRRSPGGLIGKYLKELKGKE